MEKSVLITGCSSGIGLAAAEILHKKGYRVFATARKESDVKKLAAKGLESFTLDVNDSNSIREVLDQILERTQGKLYALFNNAGFGQTGAIEDLNRDAIRAQFETNVFGPMELVIQTLPIMRKQGYGRIIQNTSILGLVALPYYGAYVGSKFALEGFSNSLRHELRRSNIFVSIIVPGPIKTQFRDNSHTVYQRSIQAKDSVHSDKYKSLESYMTTGEAPMTVTPDAVVDKLIQALEAPKPKSHYYVGIPARILVALRHIMPDFALDWIIEKMNNAQEKNW